MLVDDRDGRVVAEVELLSDALQVLDEVSKEDSELASALCLVRFDNHQGALIGTESTLRVHVLP